MKEQEATPLDIFVSPNTGIPLYVGIAPVRLYNDVEEFISDSGVLIMLDEQNENYEGTYLGKVKYVPRKDQFPYTFPLWMMFNGFIWEVRKQFPEGSLICELGCASGINYFGIRYSMIGLDFSLRSLQAIENYKYKIQANALKLPFRDESLDGIISAFFWEHIDPLEKVEMLTEFRRVLKPGGKVVMLYDVETQNGLLQVLKKKDLVRYEELFLKGDFHIGYETLEENEEKFKQTSFNVLKHFGMERTFIQSTSVYIKLSKLPSLYGAYAKTMWWINSSRLTEYLNILSLRIIDLTIGSLFSKKRSRIALSVLKK